MNSLDRTARSGLIAAMAVTLLCVPTSAHSTPPTIRHNDTQTTSEPPIIWPIDSYLPLGTDASRYPAGAPEQLLLRFGDQHSGGHYLEAAEYAVRLAQAIPDRPEGHYNLACVMARLHRTDEALDALDLAVQNGFRNMAHLRLDPDLLSLRGTTRFREIVASLRNLIDAERLADGPLRVDEPDVIVADLDANVPGLLGRYHVAGVTIALVRDGEAVWTGAYGINELLDESRIAMDEESLFPLAAPMHLVTLVAALQQDRLGRLDVVELLAFEAAQLPERTRQVRFVAHDLSVPSVREYGVGGRPTEVMIRLQSEVTRVSDVMFSLYCRSQIFAPLAMVSTRFMIEDPELFPLAQGHTRLGTPMPDPPSVARPTGSWGFFTAADLARLLEAVLGGSSQGEAIGIETPLFASIDAGDAELLNRLGLGLTLEETDHGCRARLAGSGLGVGCHLEWYPGTGIGVVVLYNSENGAEAARRIAHLALGGEG